MNELNFTTAPLPFQGQKRRFLKDFKVALKHFDQSTLFVDLFGGSGLLSHTVIRERPDAYVYYNDFDDYHIRLYNIPRTNALLADIRIIVSGAPNDKILANKLRERIINRIECEALTGFVDYITLSSSLLFSMNYVMNLEDMKKQTMYNCVRKSNYALADGYLSGINVVKCDYRELFERFKNDPNVVFLVDPPYLSTDVSTYTNYWRLANYLDVLTVLKGTNYFYFTSNKSSILEFCEWVEKNLNAENPFNGAVMKGMNVGVGNNAGYTDIMLYKKV